jgi:hypothetical protein
VVLGEHQDALFNEKLQAQSCACKMPLLCNKGEGNMNINACLYFLKQSNRKINQTAVTLNFLFPTEGGRGVKEERR